MKIGLISHLIRDYNLGCSALAISNLKLMDEVFEKYNITVEYVVILAESGEKRDLEAYTSLEGFTKNKFSYKTYPRPKNMLLRPWILKATHAFEQCDYVIDLCGGDGYTDNYGIKRIFAESIPILGCKLNQICAFFGPQTIGPFNTKLGEIVARNTLKKLKVIFVRDQSSYQCCKKLGFENKTYQVIDVAFALHFTKQYFNNNKFNIGINVSGLLYNGGYNHDNYFKLSFSYKDFIDKLIDKLCEMENVQVHLVPHVIYDNKNVDDDYSVCEKLHSNFPDTILPGRFGSAMEAKSYISGMNLFSGARMHSTIGATSSCVPVIPVAYSRKFNGLFDTLGYPYYIDAKTTMGVDSAIDQFMDYMNNLEDLKKGIKNAEKIYHANLIKYQELLVQVMELNNIN
ncbi:hypothetical protein bsdtb5_35740 [Anaeromicropila herbilytica]|uniref:Polysaccharide pyruvyl transferase domain-containing protein n=2 Tax=Anaeromicropila herbilytica TaxID=2785025 RepID=A0A7R7EP14_9FIRM|nr:hypothetical protein bsdtb5_35740 [Anaeromicropila herbilytica]